MIELYNIDCMEYLKTLEDNSFELAIVDPPYGVGQHFNFRYGVGDEVYINNRPEPEFFIELFRVSVNQIIWGGNYFTNDLKESRCWMSWSKSNPAPNFSDFELAWSSFDKVSKELRLDSYGFNHADRRKTGQSTIHPTQKPVTLYEWLLMNYANEGDKILDTHLGSGSIAIAAHNLGFDLVGCELDTEYYNAACKRLKQHQAQLTMEL